MQRMAVNHALNAVRAMMYGYGDDPVPLKETADLVEVNSNAEDSQTVVFVLKSYCMHKIDRQEICK